LNRLQPYVHKAMTIKYLFMAIPAIIIVVNFFMVNRLPEVQYLSIVALCVYAFLFVVYRFRTSFTSGLNNIVTSPINGKVVDIQTVTTGVILTIKKPYFAPCELVTCTSSDIPKALNVEAEQVSWQATGYTSQRHVKVFISQTINEQGILVGLAPGAVIMEVFIPATYAVQVAVGNEVRAGQTALAGIASETQEA